MDSSVVRVVTQNKEQGLKELPTVRGHIKVPQNNCEAPKTLFTRKYRYTKIYFLCVT